MASLALLDASANLAGPMSTETLHPDLTERDLLPVKELIEDVRAKERDEHLVSAAVTWLNAFSQFKRLRRRYGLPSSKAAVHAYAAVVGDLKSSGRMILCFMEREGFPIEQAAIDKRNFEACVRELQCDDVIIDLGLLEADLSHIEAAFAT
jgi:hypothetical protein